MRSVSTPAGLARRLVAAVYDLAQLICLWALATCLLLPFTHGHAILGHSLSYRLYLFYVPFLYFGLFWVHGGASLGMRAWRLRLQTGNGTPPGWGRVAVRYVSAWLGWLSVAGILMIAIDSRGRSLQDWVSGTQVVVLPRSG